MALWQYNFFVLPVSNILNIESLELDKDGSFDDTTFWKRNKISCDFFDDIQKILPKARSWSSDLIIYGSEESNRFEVLCENNNVISVSFRIDFTTNYEFVLREIIEFCILRGFVILNEDLKIVPLSFEAAKNVIDSSVQIKKYNGFL